jgi:[ribosomal protein S5]-alanine N-acetyltransferase
MFELNTNRLILRSIRVTDDDALHRAVFGDSEVMLFGDGIQTKIWVRAWITRQLDQYQARGYGPYAVVEKNSSDVVGYCGLFHFPDVNGQPEIEIGYRLARPAWGKGFATEAARGVRDYAFTTLSVERLIAIIDPSNIASIRVAEKIGCIMNKMSCSKVTLTPTTCMGSTGQNNPYRSIISSSLGFTSGHSVFRML